MEEKNIPAHPRGFFLGDASRLQRLLYKNPGLVLRKEIFRQMFMLIVFPDEMPVDIRVHATVAKLEYIHKNTSFEPNSHLMNIVSRRPFLINCPWCGIEIFRILRYNRGHANMTPIFYVTTHTPKKPLVLSTKFLTDFCIHKGIKKNIAAFLDYLSKKGLNKTDADLFMLGCGVKETIFKSPQKVLFHGTTKKFSVLDLGPDEKIYATDNPDYAIFLGIIKLDRGGERRRING